MAAGLVLHPFKALRYDPGRIGDLSSVLSPPYDVIDDALADELAARSEYNAVRLVLPRDESGPQTRYADAAARLHEWRRDGVLLLDPQPALYVYEETVDGHVQRGLVGALELVEPDAGVVLPHEDTMAGPVADRLALTTATEANLESIMLLVDGGEQTAAVVDETVQGVPIIDTKTADGVRHRVWAITSADGLQRIHADLVERRAVIADGHHRYATYLRYQLEQHTAGATIGPWDRGLAYVIDASRHGPQVHAIHRVVRGLSAQEAARRAAGSFQVQPVAGGRAEALQRLADAGPGSFVLADGHAGWWLLSAPDPAAVAASMPPGRSAAWQRLDVAVAHHYLIRTVWGLADDEATVDYRHDVDAALEAAAAGGSTALLVNPTPLEAVVAVAAAGDRMPRKSTLFTPKPASGLLMRALTDG